MWCPTSRRPADVEWAISNSFAFGGLNAVLGPPPVGRVGLQTRAGRPRPAARSGRDAARRLVPSPIRSANLTSCGTSHVPLHEAGERMLA